MVAGEWADVVVEFRGVNGRRKSNFESESLDDTIEITTTKSSDLFTFQWVRADKAGRYRISLTTTKTFSLTDDVRLQVMAKPLNGALTPATT